MKTGIIGYGAIGHELVRYILEGKAGKAQLTAILVRNKEGIQSDLPDTVFYDDPDDFFALELDAVVEAAGHEAVRLYAERVLEKSDFIVAGVGAFADTAFYDEVLRAAEQSGQRLIIPSCAIGGLDRIAAGALGPVERVTLVSSKPPRAWYGTAVEEQMDLSDVKERVCIFEGPAKESAVLFPQSVNVSAALSLVGVGFEKTYVRVMVDPGIHENVHEIEAVGLFGDMHMKISNTPSENPKTGWIVSMSIAKALKNLSTSLIIGI